MLSSRSAILPVLGLAGCWASAAALGQTANLEIMATVEASCTVNGATLNFGTYRKEEAATAQTAIGYSCPAGLDISLSLSPGQQSQNGSRAMVRNGGGDVLLYDLYKDAARNQVWGEQADAKTVSPTTDGDATVQVYGEIEAGQPAAAGDYRDTVVITLVVE